MGDRGFQQTVLFPERWCSGGGAPGDDDAVGDSGALGNCGVLEEWCSRKARVPGKLVLQGKWGPGDGSVQEKWCSGRH